MINLLPPTLKEQYIYGRRNTTLRHWLVACLCGLVGVGLVTSAGLIYIQRSINQYTVQVTHSESALKAQKLEAVQKHSEDITNSLKLVVDVLSREVLFSQLLKQIGSVTPPNTALTDLSISKVQGAIEITAIASDYNAATQLQANLQDPANKIFSKADIQNITCSNSSAADPRYPCTVAIRALFTKNNPFLFINTGDTKP